jgi:hypothetical protein
MIITVVSIGNSQHPPPTMAGCFLTLTMLGWRRNFSNNPICVFLLTKLCHKNHCMFCYSTATHSTQSKHSERICTWNQFKDALENEEIIAKTAI